MYIKSMISNLKIFLSNNKVFNAMILVSMGSVVSTFISYYYNFYVQSLFPSYSDYGDFILIVTFLSIILLAPSSVSTSLSILVTELKVKNSFKELTKLYLRMNLLFAGIGLLLGLFFYLLIKEISISFNIANIDSFRLFPIILFLAVATIPVNSYLYGLLKFKSFVFNALFTIFIKLLFLIIFYKLGFGFSSIFYGFIVSYILNFIFGNIFLIKSLDFVLENAVIKGLTKKVLFFSLPLFFILTGNGMLTQIDFLVIKSKFSSELSGQYALLLNIGKIFFFGSFIFLGAMGSQITEAYNKKERYFNILFFYLKIVSSVVFVGLLFLGIFPNYFLDFFVYLSSHIGLSLASLNFYYSVLDLIPIYSVFIGLVIFINFLVLFLIATSTTRIYLAFIISLFIQFLSIKLLATNLFTSIICNIITASILLTYLIMEVYKKYESFDNSTRL